MLQLGPRHPQHLEALVERDDPRCPFDEEFRHPPGAGADVEQFAQRLTSQRAVQGCFDLFVRAVAAAQVVPFCGMRFEPFGGLVLAGVANRGELDPILFALRGEFGVFLLRDGEQPGHRRRQRRSLRGLCRGAQIDPAAFAATDREPRITQDRGVARDARLALLEHLRQLTHGKFHRAEQPHDPQPGGVAKRAQDGFGPHRDPTYKDIFISTSPAAARGSRSLHL